MFKRTCGVVHSCNFSLDSLSNWSPEEWITLLSMSNNKLFTSLSEGLNFWSSLDVASNLGLNRELPAGLWDSIGWIGPARLGQLPCFKDGVRGAFLFRTPPNQKLLPRNVDMGSFCTSYKMTVWSPPKSKRYHGKIRLSRATNYILVVSDHRHQFPIPCLIPCGTCRMPTGTWASIDFCANSDELKKTAPSCHRELFAL